MDKAYKIIRKLQSKYRNTIENEINDILDGNLKGKDVKRLQGKRNYFRVRKGKFRIIFTTEGEKISIVKVAHRDNQTYLNL
jgi:mRNA-degrading endonuclease RelE of RelBE toxin-antitoxin system